MPNERESLSALTAREYDIDGNLVRAFVNDDGDIVFVLDMLVDENKPNVLLVIDAVDDRKWDDVLENDYGVDLETVRPKKDNKYQKLDIEYSGLNVYRDLIAKYIAGDDVADSIIKLNDFRRVAVRRAATERLAVAEKAAENARETITKTIDSVHELDTRLRQLRVKLSDVRKGIGKEPTKQSAAKVLRVESQIDATNEKIRRAKKRLDNAQKRLIAATDDADVARDILVRLGGADVSAKDLGNSIVPAPDNDEISFFPIEADEQQDLTITNNTKAEDMADEEVKPLFDTDPEILDEEIAFKPIDFNAPIVAPDMTPVVQPEPQLPDVYEDPKDDVAIEPLSFTPPINTEPLPEEDVVLPSQMVEFAPAPVLDSITAVETPTGFDVEEQQTEFIPQPVAPSYAQPAQEPMPVADVAPAPVDSGLRPVSPLTGVAPVVASSGATKHKQSAVYYIMLFALIVMSIFVLWFYQKSTAENALPNIGGKVVPETVQTEEEVVEADVPTVVDVEEVSVDEEVVAEPVVEPEPVVVEPEPEPMPEPVVIEAEPTPVEPVEIVVPVTAPVINTVPTVVPEPKTVKVETEEEVLAKKPAYGVSQKEAMFVADDKFETDRLAPAVEEVVTVNAYDTPIVRVAESVPVVEYDEPKIVQEYIEEDEELICDGGATPDRFGCCPGESYTQIDNGGFVCCPDAGGDCFPPLF